MCGVAKFPRVVNTIFHSMVMEELLLHNHNTVEAAAAAEQPSPNPSQRKLHRHFTQCDAPWHPSNQNVHCHPIPSTLESQTTIMTSRRSHSAPCIFTDNKELPVSLGPDTEGIDTRSMPSIVKQAIIGVILYISVGVVVYLVKSGSFKGHSTYRLVDALYFTIVTLCTIGYGDIVPGTDFAKLFMCAFILVGFGFVDIVLHGLVTYVLDKQEAVLLSSMDDRQHNVVFWTYVMDVKKGRMRVRMKVGLALGVVIGCIAIGAVVVHELEGLRWPDSLYLSVTSVTTVGYGDYAFSTVEGRLFAAVWLLVSTLAVARAFLYLTELRIEKRNRRIAKWVLQRKMTARDLVAADLDNDGSISKSEFVIYKLKEMGKAVDKDIMQICDQFDRLDIGNCGKITLSDLINSRHDLL